VEESVDDATFGSAVHYVLHKVYQGSRGKVIRTWDIESFFPRVEELMSPSFHESFPGGEYEIRANHLMFRGCHPYGEVFLEKEAVKIREDEENGSHYEWKPLKKLHGNKHGTEDCPWKHKGKTERDRRPN